MAIGAFIPLAVFVVVAGSVGFRLIGLWRRTRELPEMSLGFGLAGMAVGMPMAAAGRAPAITMDPLGRTLFCLGLSINLIGVCLMMYFTYRVFRPGVGWAKVLYAAMCAVNLAAGAWICTMNATGESVEQIKLVMRPATVALMGNMLVAFVWATVESFSFRRALLRQLTLGLSDPVIANRFWLWGVAGATSGVLMAVLIGCVMRGMTIVHEPLPLAVMAASGMVMSASWYLTFFAPAGYQRFIRERAAQNP